MRLLRGLLNSHKVIVTSDLTSLAAMLLAELPTEILSVIFSYIPNGGCLVHIMQDISPGLLVHCLLDLNTAVL
ncbi:hypothetical protein EYZ11_010150 [Aspergillus tanneri]|uniref:F-box domain-containing protein n=1 Tax=Aspergillus tanneri TaxID=1220188 RepID=A0A4S3J880_9EURO|nr:hypothetical protein EYZ11_010150 [Aspergillus tanneri]